MNEQGAHATNKYIRIPPRKARLVAALIRRKPVIDAITLLSHGKRKGERIMHKTLLSAVANAEHNSNIDREDLVVDEVRIDGGPTLKRGKPRSKGSSVPILKRTSHFYIKLRRKEA